jgi:hypothetical protein
MKKTIFNKAAIAMAGVIALTSCNDLFNSPDIQKNPNAPADAPIEVLLSGVGVGVATAHEDTDTRIASYWSGGMAGQSRQQLGYQDYIVSSTTFDNSWFLIYHPAANARLIQQKAAPLNNKVALGTAQVLEALQMAKITSLYGDVPYSQAFDIEKFPKPVFDKQTDIYAALIATLGSAYTNLKTGLGGFDAAGSNDFYYQGNPDKWAAAAKTLQARLYLHLKDYPNAIAAANLGIKAGNDMLVPHGGAQTIDLNLNFDMFENSRPGDCGFDIAYLPVFMKAGGTGTNYKRNAKTNDFALYSHYFQVGIYTDGLDPNTVDGAFQGDSYHPILTFNENQLILAEALARTNQITPAVIALNSVRQNLVATGAVNGNKIKASYASGGKLQYDDYLDIDFLPAGVADAGQGTQQKNVIYEILSTKFTLSLLQYEAFNDLRRTQVATPVVKLPIPFNIPTATQYPARFIYSQNEINTNPNVPKNSSGGVADIYQKVPVFAN